MNKTLPVILCLSFLLAACAAPIPEPISTPIPTPVPFPTAKWERQGWVMAWQDEFDDTELDLKNWTFDIGGGGWGNQEWEAYTDRSENVRVEDGMLVIEARREEELIGGREYSSTRIKTQGLHAWQYGRVEARIQLPYGQGIWPAFWMLGEDIENNWPACGEIDIMEFIGNEPDQIYATVHGPGYSGGDGVGSSLTVPSAESLKNDFHVYAIEWEKNEIRWYFDDQEYFNVTAEDVPAEWVFDHPFFIILNVAVGGEWPGYPDVTTVFPQFMYVDYVRVYQKP